MVRAAGRMRRMAVDIQGLDRMVSRREASVIGTYLAAWADSFQVGSTVCPRVEVWIDIIAPLIIPPEYDG